MFAFTEITVKLMKRVIRQPKRR